MIKLKKEKISSRFKPGDNKGSVYIPWATYATIYDEVLSKKEIKKGTLFTYIFNLGLEAFLLELEKEKHYSYGKESE